jgi:hypothetical protein
MVSLINALSLTCCIQHLLTPLVPECVIADIIIHPVIPVRFILCSLCCQAYHCTAAVTFAIQLILIVPAIVSAHLPTGEVQHCRVDGRRRHPPLPAHTRH